MKNIEHTHKLSVLHCVYQVIGSADGVIDEERDYHVIKAALDTLGLESIYAWDAALKLNPHDCFYHISTFNEPQKKQFKELLLSITEMGGNSKLRIICANHILQLCEV